MSIELAETAEEVSSIAFGFMASKALFAGLHIDVFTHLADGPKTCGEIASKTDIPENRVETLMTALNSIGLVDCADKRYANSPAADAYLSRTSKYEFGDYLRYQIDQQMYPFLGQLNEVLDGSLGADAVDSYQHWMSDPKQAAPVQQRPARRVPGPRADHCPHGRPDRCQILARCRWRHRGDDHSSAGSQP